jgi:L-ascorbate metabolism protein UlaG (beta-lactamase superfamily)
VKAEIQFQWLGITGFSLSDGKTIILFDPVVTRPTVFDILFRRAIQSDSKLVKEWIQRSNLARVDGTFISHSHHDHSLDFPEFHKTLGGFVYGSSSTIKIAESFGINSKERKIIKIGDTIEIGLFKITAVENAHAPIIGPLYFAKGEINSKIDQSSSVFDYKMGDSFGFFIQHPEGNIVFQATANFPSQYEKKTFPANVVLLSLAKIDSSDDLLNKVLSLTSAKKIIPLHFDNFMKPIQKDKVEYLFGVDMEQFKSKIQKRSKDLLVIEPQYLKPIKLY